MRNKKFIIIITLISISILVKMIIDQIEFNSYICKTKEIQLKTVIVDLSGRANDQRVQVKGIKNSFSLYTSKTIFNKGFSDDYVDIKEGDSIFKNKNSKLITITRGDKKAIYLLDCCD